MYLRLKQSQFVNQDKGFSLVEILIYIAILGLIVSGFIAFVLSISDVRSKAYVEQEVQSNCRTAMDMIAQKIRASNSVDTEASVFDTHPGVLTLNLDEASKDPTVIDVNDALAIQIKEGDEDPLAITSDEVMVSELVFVNLTGEGERANIQVLLSLNYDSTADVIFNYPVTLQTSVSVRE